MIPNTPWYKKSGHEIPSSLNKAKRMNGMIYVSKGFVAAGLKNVVHPLTFFRSISQYKKMKITVHIPAEYNAHVGVAQIFEIWYAGRSKNPAMKSAAAKTTPSVTRREILLFTR